MPRKCKITYRWDDPFDMGQDEVYSDVESFLVDYPFYTALFAAYKGEQRIRIYLPNYPATISIVKEAEEDA